MGRARIRAREIRRLLRADLDDDGVVAEAEISVLIAAEAATARGRLYLAFRSADQAGGGPDERVDLDEMRGPLPAGWRSTRSTRSRSTGPGRSCWSIWTATEGSRCAT